jgi:hypothetical protein
VTKEEVANAELEIQMKQLLAKIEKEPISDEIRALSQELQKNLDARRAAEKSKV